MQIIPIVTTGKVISRDVIKRRNLSAKCLITFIFISSLVLRAIHVRAMPTQLCPTVHLLKKNFKCLIRNAITRPLIISGRASADLEVLDFRNHCNKSADANYKIAIKAESGEKSQYRPRRMSEIELSRRVRHLLLAPPLAFLVKGALMIIISRSTRLKCGQVKS